MLADRKKVTNEKRRIRKLIAKERSGEIPEGTAKNSLDCWLANMEKGNTRKMRSDLINYYAERIKNE